MAHGADLAQELILLDLPPLKIWIAGDYKVFFGCFEAEFQLEQIVCQRQNGRTFREIVMHTIEPSIVSG